MRLFIALPVTERVSQALTETQAALRKRGLRGRFAPEENLHMTVVFLGSVEDPAPVIEAMRRTRLPRTALRFDRLTLFGDVLTALYRPDDALTAYAAALRAALDGAGIRYDRQAFRPHITLCRKTVFPYPDFRLFSFERTLRDLRLPAEEARLFSSDLSGDRPRYTALYIERAKR